VRKTNNIVTITEKANTFEINATLHVLGKDLLVILSGGTSHIGAIGIGEPRPSLKYADKISSTSSVFTFLGHKEDAIAKSMSEELARRLNRKAVVVAGIHWDKLTPEEFQTIVSICKRMVKKIVSEIGRVQ